MLSLEHDITRPGSRIRSLGEALLFMGAKGPSGLRLIPSERICPNLFEMLFEQLNSLRVSAAA